MIEETQQAGRHDNEFRNELEAALRNLEASFLEHKTKPGQSPQVQSKSAASHSLLTHNYYHKLLSNREALVLRSFEAISREIGHLTPENVDQLLKSSDPTLLVGLARASLEDAPIDRMDRMALKGAERFRRLLEDAGGSVSSGWVAQLLEISEEAVRKRAQRSNLIARRMASGELSFPRFQFDEANKRVLTGLSAFLSKTDSWTPDERIRFLLVRHEPEHSDDTPLVMLERGELNRVLQLTSAHLEQRP